MSSRTAPGRPPSARPDQLLRPPASDGDIGRRVAALEGALGDVRDPTNPLGWRALLAADARGEVTAEAERVLGAVRFNEEFVPRELGGRFDRLDALGRLLRPVFRRDASLGFGYGLNGFFAAAAVWIRGTPDQRRWAARHLRGEGRLTVVRHEVAHGNDFVRDEFGARFDGVRFWLNGTKSAVTNGSRASGLVVFARTERSAVGGRSHSVLLLDRSRTPAHGVQIGEPHPTQGMRGTEFTGLRAVDCPLPADALVGEIGDGFELSLRSALLIRGLLPSITLAGADTALRATLDFAVAERREGRAPLTRRHFRSVLTGAFVDLLLSDCLALVATRSVHLLPTRMSVYAAAAAYLVPKVLAEATDDLAPVLGEEQYVERGRYGMFAKQRRDLPMVALGHAGSAGRQMSILPQLPVFARSSWFREPEPPAALFRLDEPPPPLDLDRLTLLGDGDPLVATLVGYAESVDLTGEREAPGLRRIVLALVAELSDLRRACAKLTAGSRAVLASPHSFALADRYVLVLAAAAVVGVWREQRTGTASHDSFLADPAWAHAALHRIGSRLGLDLADHPVTGEHRVFDELVARHEQSRSFDLYGTPLD